MDPRLISKEQLRILENPIRVQEPIGISAVSLMELASLSQDSRRLSKSGLEEVLREIDTREAFEILPITTDIAREAARLLPVLRDPANTFIAATARAHGLRLRTSDARIVDSNCVPTVD